jgi:two-component system, OmpR family, sensor histidine kinase KdpD
MNAPEAPTAVTPADELTEAPPPQQRQRHLGDWQAYAMTTALVGLATGVGTALRTHLALPDLVMLYLLVVAVAAARFGRGPSLVAATLSILAFDFFFIPPYFTFIVSEERHVLTFALMLVVGLVTSGLTLRIRRQEHEARGREERTAALYKLSRDLSSALDAEDAALATCRHASAVFQGPAAVFVPDGQGTLVAMGGGELALDASDRSALQQAFTRKRPAGRGTDLVPEARVTCVPLTSGPGPGGVLAVSSRQPTLSTEQRHFLDAFARQAALALERARLAGQAEAAALRAYTEEMRSSLLSAVSHDLRTPLAVITGAATTLRDDGLALDGGQRAELLETICEEADRLERLVRNLLDMTQLQSGALQVKREWMPLEEIVGAALNRLDARLVGRPVRCDLPADLPLVPADPVLLELVLVNLLENAAKYTPPGSPLEIGARAHEQALHIEIADRGPGLPAGDETRIFEKFFRGKPAGIPGAGLGLAICRGIVDAHGGSLVAVNRDGGGALFRIILPILGKPPAGPPELEPPESQPSA